MELAHSCTWRGADRQCVLAPDFHINIYTTDGSSYSRFYREPGSKYFPGSTYLEAFHVQNSPPPEGPTKIVVDDGKPCSRYNSIFTREIYLIQKQQFWYGIDNDNSNSLARTLLDAAGIPGGSMPYAVRGFQTNLFNLPVPYGPIIYPSYGRK